MAHQSLLIPFILTLVAIKLDPTTTSPPPPPPRPDIKGKQLDDIVDVLIGSGDFTDWASILSTADPSDFPLGATFFVPDDPASSLVGDSRNTFMNPFVIAYHIVPRRLSFSDLLLLNNRDRIPTLLRDKSILVTNNSASAFALDDAPLTIPNLYSSPTFVIHAVAAVLNYRLYGDGPANAALPNRSPPSHPRGVAVDRTPATAGAPPCGPGVQIVGFLAASSLLIAL